MSLSFSTVVRSKLLVQRMFSKREEKLLPSDEYYSQNENLLKKNNTQKNEEFQKKLQNLKILAKNDAKTPKSAKISLAEVSVLLAMKNTLLQKKTIKTIEILKKSVELRNEADQEFLKDFFDDYDFFAKHKFEIIECAIFFTYKHFQAKDAIKPKKKLNTNSYLILHGAVSVKNEYENISSFQKGMCFNEADYVNLSIEFLEETHLAAMSNKEIEKLIIRNQLRMDQEKFLLLRSLQLFDPLSNYSLKAILSSTHFLKTKRNQIIFFEGDETKSIYIVKSGKFKLIKNIDVRDRDQDMNLQIAYAKLQKFEICILTAGDTFGEEEITNLKARQYTVICDQDDSELYFLGHMEITKRLFFEPECKTHLIDYLNNRERIRNLRLEDSEQYLKSFYSKKQADVPDSEDYVFAAKRKRKNINIHHEFHKSHFSISSFTTPAKHSKQITFKNEKTERTEGSQILTKRPLSADVMKKRLFSNIPNLKRNFENFQKNEINQEIKRPNKKYTMHSIRPKTAIRVHTKEENFICDDCKGQHKNGISFKFEKQHCSDEKNESYELPLKYYSDHILKGIKKKKPLFLTNRIF